MAKTEGEPVLDSDQEEIALSDSELDDVLKSADITSETTQAEQGNLEQYGVWVKVEPHNIEEEAEQNMSFELSDLDSSSESALTEEEEQLLGELEEDEETDLGDLSGLEDDLEELGKGSAFEEQGGEEELSVEDLDVDLEELSDDSGDLEVLPEMGGEEDLSLETAPDTIEVPLSDSAIVEEHYEDLATVEGVPSTPGQAPPKGSSDILEKIERDLIQIKTEIQSLKNELAGLGKGGISAGKVDVAPAPSGGEGFFEKGEDETIALTGDELDNILNTADVTEEVEVPEESVESLEVEEFPEPDLAELPEEAGGEEEIMELGSLNLEEEEAPSAEISLEDSDLSLEELEPSEDEEQSIEIDIGGKAPEEELSLEEPAEALELEELEELGLDESGLEEVETPEELSLEEPAEALELEELEELGLDESGLEEAEAPEELSLEEPAEVLPAEELELEGLEELGLDESGLEEVEVPEELSLEEPAEVLPAEEDLEELSLEEPAEVLPGEDELEELDLEVAAMEEVEGLEVPEAEDVLALDELEESTPQTGEAEDLELTTEELDIPVEESAAGGAQPISEALTEDLRSEIKSVLSYFDQLLEALPEDKIKEFAQSEYFVRYQRLFKELGLGA
jgi:pilus assembly protein FimV